MLLLLFCVFLLFLFLHVLSSLALKLFLSKCLSQFTLAQVFAAGATLVAPLPVGDEQDVQTVFILVGDHDVQMGVRLIAGGVLGPPAQQARDAPDVGVDREALTLQTEQQNAAGGLGADALERQHLLHCLLARRRVEVVQRVFAVLGVRLIQYAHDHFALDHAEPAAFDGLLQFRLPARHDRLPVVAAVVDVVHASLCSR